MWRVFLNLALVCCVGLSTAWAQDVRRAEPSEAGESSTGARAPSRVVGPGAPAPARQPGREPSAARPIRRPGGGDVSRPPRGQPAAQRPPRRVDPDAPPHRREVCRLENAPAMDVAKTLKTLLGELREVGQLPNEVVVVPDLVTNSLVISAAPGDLEQVVDLLKELDQGPRSVRVELLIAQVQQKAKPKTPLPKRSSGEDGLGAVWEGWQSERKPVRLNTAAKLLVGAGGPQRSKSSKGVDQKLRALQSSGQLKILSRPQITTLDNQPAMILVGQKIPVLRPARSKESTQAATLAYEDVGLTVGLTPRISPRGRVTMEIDVEKSEIGPVTQSVAAGVLDSGKVLRLPRIERTTLQTTINVADGESTVIGGLTVESGTNQSKLLIVLTPHIIED